VRLTLDQHSQKALVPKETLVCILPPLSVVVVVAAAEEVTATATATAAVVVVVVVILIRAPDFLVVGVAVFFIFRC
jgi:hypothetical protein